MPENYRAQYRVSRLLGGLSSEVKVRSSLERTIRVEEAQPAGEQIRPSQQHEEV